MTYIYITVRLCVIPCGFFKRTIANACDVIGNRDIFQAAAIIKCTLANACYAVRKRNAFQVATTAERIRAYYCYAVRNRNAFQVVTTAERIRAYHCYAVRNCYLYYSAIIDKRLIAYGCYRITANRRRDYHRSVRSLIEITEYRRLTVFNIIVKKSARSVRNRTRLCYKHFRPLRQFNADNAAHDGRRNRHKDNNCARNNMFQGMFSVVHFSFPPYVKIH